jgi:hypothetical protein
VYNPTSAGFLLSGEPLLPTLTEGFMLKASKILQGQTILSPQGLETLAHNLVFQNKLTQAAVDSEGAEAVLIKNLPLNALHIYNQVLDAEAREMILESFTSALGEALEDYQYSEFSEFDQPDDGNQGVRRFR